MLTKMSSFVSFRRLTMEERSSVAQRLVPKRRELAFVDDETEQERVLAMAEGVGDEMV